MGRPYGTCTAEDGLEATAARRPNGQARGPQLGLLGSSEVAVVVLNCGDRDVEYKLKYTTMAAKLKIPAHGIQTLLFEASQPFLDAMWLVFSNAWAFW